MHDIKDRNEERELHFLTKKCFKVNECSGVVMAEWDNHSGAHSETIKDVERFHKNYFG